jgi:hypothetical protein
MDDEFELAARIHVRGILRAGDGVGEKGAALTVALLTGEGIIALAMSFVFSKRGSSAADCFGQIFRQQTGKFITGHTFDHLSGFEPFLPYLGAVGPARNCFAFHPSVGRGFTPRRPLPGMCRRGLQAAGVACCGLAFAFLFFALLRHPERTTQRSWLRRPREGPAVAA